MDTHDHPELNGGAKIRKEEKRRKGYAVAPCYASVSSRCNMNSYLLVWCHLLALACPCSSSRWRARNTKKTNVHPKHDGRAGHDPQEMRRQSAVHAGHPFLFPDEPETLREPGVFHLAVLRGRQPETRADDLCHLVSAVVDKLEGRRRIITSSFSHHRECGGYGRQYLVRIGGDGGEQLRRPRRAQFSTPAKSSVPGGTSPPVVDGDALASGHIHLHLFVQNPLDRAFRDAQIAGAEAPVQTGDALLAEHLSHAVEAVLVSPVEPSRPRNSFRLGFIQLQPRLDEPDGVRGRAGDNAGRGRGAEMHPCRLAPVVEVLAYQPLTVAVCVEVDGPRRHDAGQVGTEPLEQGAPSLDAVDREEDLKGFAHVEGHVVRKRQRLSRPDASRRPRRGQLRLVVVGLKSCLEDVKRRSQESRGHATNAR